MNKFSGAQNWERYLLAFLFIAALFILFAAIMPVDAQRSGCTKIRVGTTYDPNEGVPVGNPTVTTRTSCDRRIHQFVTTVTTRQKYQAPKYYQYRDRCYCTQTGRWEWGPVYTDKSVQIGTQIYYVTTTVSTPTGRRC